MPPSTSHQSSGTHFHWAYSWIPLFGACLWLATLIALLITWAVDGRPKYVSQEGRIPYISDIGADRLKPLFIVACAVTAATFIISLMIERWLRHRGRLPTNMRKRERVFGILAVLSAIVGGAGLILLAVFDTKNYERPHRGYLLMFSLGVILSAIFTVAEYRWISKGYRDYRRVRIAYRIKAVFATVILILAIAFAVALYRAKDAGAVLEWIIGFLFAFYLLTFIYDLRLSKYEAETGYIGGDRGRSLPGEYPMR